MVKLTGIVVTFLDFFYPIVQKFLKKQTYYYLACGGGNTLFGFVLYYMCYHYLLHRENFDMGFYAMKPHIASFFFSFIITFPIGFWLSRHVVWSESYLKGRQQLFRHLVLVVVFVFMNYVLLKLFVEYFQWWPLPSQVITTIIIVICSYVAQKNYSFKE